MYLRSYLIFLVLCISGCATLECRQLKDYYAATPICETGYYVPDGWCLSNDELTFIKRYCSNF
jgi:hypothetical protein